MKNYTSMVYLPPLYSVSLEESLSIKNFQKEKRKEKKG